MADNKKTKTDFSTGLKAAAEKLKPRDLRKDVLTITIGGVPTPIARGDMSDVDWANVVKQSVKEATPGEYKQPFPDRSDEPEAAHNPAEEAAEPVKGEEPVEDVKRSIDWPRLMSLGQNLDQIDKSLVSDEEKGHLKGMSEWSRAEFLRERMRGRGYDVPKTTAEAERESFKKEATVEKAPAEKPAPKQPSQQKPGTQTEDTMQLGSADPGMSVRGNMQRLATGAAPKNIVTSSLAEVGGDALNKVAPMEGGFPGASNPAPMEGGFPGASNPAPMEGGFTGLPSMMGPSVGATSPINFDQPMSAAPIASGSPINFDQPSQGDGGPLGRILAPDSGAWPGAITGEQAKGLPPSPNVTGASPPPAGVPIPPGAPATAPGGSASLSLSGVGGFTPAQVDPAAVAFQKQAQAEAVQGQRDAQSRIQAEAENQKAITDKAAEIEINERQKADILGALAAQSQMDAVKHAESWSAARMSAAQTARDAAANPIDPNRYWNSKGDGQRAMAVLAGALYGFAGQGQQWLQRIDGLVDADNRLQAADRASKVEGLKGYAAEMGQQADDAMKFGLSRAQAQLLARTQKLEGLKSQLDILAMQQTDSARAQQGAMMSAQLSQHIDSIASQGLSLAQQQAQMKSADRYHNAQLAMERMKLQVKRAAKAGDLGTKIPQAQQGIISAAEAGLGMLPELEKAIGNPKGEISTALADQIAKQFPGTDANNRSISTAFLNRAIFAGIDKSVINAADQKFLDEIQSGVGISSLRKPGAVAALRRMLNESKKAAIRTAQQLDQNTGGLSAMDTTTADDYGFEAAQ